MTWGERIAEQEREVQRARSGVAVAELLAKDYQRNLTLSRQILTEQEERLAALRAFTGVAALGGPS